MNTGYKVCDAMTSAPVAVSPEMSVMECAKEQDLVRKGLTKDVKPSQMKAKDIMETQLISVGPEEDISDALQVMKDYNIRHVPVMAEGKMVGFITGKDILKIQPDLFEILAEKIQLREEERKLRRLGE